MCSEIFINLPLSLVNSLSQNEHYDTMATILFKENNLETLTQVEMSELNNKFLKIFFINEVVNKINK